MPVLNDTLGDFAHAIVKCGVLSASSHDAGLNYSLATALAIYRNNYRGNLHDALAGAYPVLEQLVGSDFFRLITREFIAQHPSRSGNLHHYGAEMAEFIALFEPARNLVYLPDVARLEWACHQSYFAEDVGMLDIDSLAGIPPASYAALLLHCQPACYLVNSQYPVAAIWLAHQSELTENFCIDFSTGPCNALVSRMDDVVHVRELSDADADWLQSLRAGQPLGAATETTLERYPDFDLQAALLNLVAQGVLTSFSVNNKP